MCVWGGGEGARAHMHMLCVCDMKMLSMLMIFIVQMTALYDSDMGNFRVRNVCTFNFRRVAKWRKNFSSENFPIYGTCITNFNSCSLNLFFF